MKILFWMFSGFDRHITSEHLLSSVIERLCEDGHTVHIIQKKTGGNLPPIPESLSRYNITTDVIQYGILNKSNLVTRYIKELKYVIDSKRVINNNYEAVFIQSNTVTGFAVKVARTILPNAIITLNVQDIFPYNAVYSGNIKKYGLVFKLMAWLQRYGYRNSNHIITISEDMKDTLVQDGTPAEKIEIIYNWSYQDEPYDRDKLDMSVPNKLFRKEYFNVVYAGNIGRMQNVDILINAAKLMKENKNVWFHIIGDGVFKNKLEMQAKEYGITNISFWPMQAPEFAPSLYSAADVNVIPLAKDVYRTALPSKTATCLACGQPIIFAIGKQSKFGQKATRETGCVVVESNKAEDLVEMIEFIRSNSVQRMKTQAFFSRFFSMSANSKRFAEIISSR